VYLTEVGEDVLKRELDELIEHANGKRCGGADDTMSVHAAHRRESTWGRGRERKSVVVRIAKLRMLPAMSMNPVKCTNTKKSYSESYTCHNTTLTLVSSLLPSLP
jgi:hypothetical protein